MPHAASTHVEVQLAACADPTLPVEMTYGTSTTVALQTAAHVARRPSRRAGRAMGGLKLSRLQSRQRGRGK